MNALKTLVIMQLKEKLNLRERQKSKKKQLFSVVFSILKFALIVGLCFVILFLSNYLHLFSLINRIPTSIITVVFTVMLFISVISSTFALTKSMYYSYDNPVLLTLPCKPAQVYISKLIVFYIYELIRNLSFIVPMFIAYGIISKLSLVYYFWLIICFIFISMVPILVGAILSIPMMWFYNLFRQYKRLQFTSLLVLGGIVTFVVVKAISLIPENIDLLGTWGTTYWQIQDFLAVFIEKFALLHSVVEMIVGVRVGLVNKIFVFETFITFGLLILSIIVLFAVGLLLVKPLFYKMASKPFEYRKNKVKEKKNKKMPKGFAKFKNEVLLNIREPERVFSSITILVALPVLIFFLNKIFLAMSTRLLGNNMTIAFNILIILLITLSSNTYAASVFSRDGRSSYLIKVQPSKYQPLLLSKLFFNSIVMIVSFIATFFVLYINTSLGLNKSLMIILATACFWLAHLFYSAELDIMNPQIELYSTIGNSDNNSNETKSTLMAFLISFVVFGLFLLLLIENAGLATYVKLFVVALVIMILRMYLLLNKIKLYYMEK